MQASILIPTFFLVFLTLAVAVRLITTRVQAARQGKVRLSYYKGLLPDGKSQPTEAMHTASRQFTNLFEVPTLFYVAVVIALILQIQSAAFVALCWLFVIARYVQAAIQLTYNNVIHRMSAFLLGFGCVLGMWSLIAVHSLS